MGTRTFASLQKVVQSTKPSASKRCGQTTITGSRFSTPRTLIWLRVDRYTHDTHDTHHTHHTHYTYYAHYTHYTHSYTHSYTHYTHSYTHSYTHYAHSYTLYTLSTHRQWKMPWPQVRVFREERSVQISEVRTLTILALPITLVAHTIPLSLTTTNCHSLASSPIPHPHTPYPTHPIGTSVHINKNDFKNSPHLDEVWCVERICVE